MMNKVIQIIFKTFLLSVLVAGQVNFAYAQTASILPPAKTQLLDNNGKPLVSGTVDFYIPGTTTRKTTWQDSSETIPNTNPVVLDGAGRAIILGDGSYRQIVKDRLGNLIWDQQTSSTGTGGGGTTATVGDGDAVGTIKPWSGFTAPSQYVFSYGQELARASFPLLFSTLTSQQNISCTSGSPTLTSVGDTSQIPTGSPVESICLNAGATVIGTTISTVTVSSNAIISTNSSARFFPFGNGDGSLTFNTPDLRGRVLAGRDNMGGVSANRLTSVATGFGAAALLGATGGSQNQTLTLAQLPTGITTTGNISVVTPNNTYLNAPATGFGITSFSANAGAQVWQAFSNGAVVSQVTNITSTGTNTLTSNNTSGAAHPNIQPTEILNYIIKTLPDTNANSFFGVASIGGMFGVLTCGTGITCAGNQISAVSSVIPSPTAIDLGGVFSKTCSTSNWFNTLDTTGTFGCSQPNFTDLAGSISLTQLGTVPLSNGGTGSNITPSNGGIFWSNSTVGQLLAGTATAKLPLLSGANATPVWGAFTLPTSVTSGGVAYFSSTTAMASSALLTANAFMVGGGAGVAPTSIAITGLVLGNGASAPTAYGGTTCANQFIRALSASGGATCNTVSLTADVTGTLPIGNGGTSQTTVLAARGSSGLNIDGATSTGDANYTILSTDRMIYHTALTAARTDTLPLANSVNAGQQFIINDFRGVVGATNTITLQRSGSDTINGITSLVAINSQFGAGIFWSDGISRWTFFPQSSGGGGGTVTNISSNGCITGGPISTTGTLTFNPACQRGYLSGLILSAAGSVSTYGISSGAANDNTNVSIMLLASNYSKTTGAWTLGTTNGGLDTGTIAANTWYHVFLMQRPDTGVVDICESITVTSCTTGGNIPAAYTLFRRIGSMKTDGSSNWTAFIQNGSEFLWNVPVGDVSTTLGTTATLFTLSTPLGINAEVMFNSIVAGAANAGYLITSPLVSTQVFDTPGGNLTAINANSTGNNSGGSFRIRTNTSSQVRAVASVASTNIQIATTGWIDNRGRDN